MSTEVTSGSSGVRGMFNNGFDVELALHIGKIIGERYGGTVAVASDSRASGETLKSAVSAGLMSMGVEVIDIGTMPTPALQYYVKTHDDVNGGVMVTASHNPPEYNGVKAIASDGLEDPFLSDESVTQILQEDVRQVQWANIGEVRDVDGCLDEYVDAIISHVDAKAISDANMKVCVECAHGVAFNVVPYLLRKLGVEQVTINGSSEGELEGHDSELSPDNLRDLGYMTSHTNCDLGVAFDMDADRCLFVIGNGDMVPGDKSFIVIARSVLQRRKGKVVVSVASSSAIEECLESSGGMVKYVSVGAPNIVKKVMEYEAILGGEMNGGIVFPEHQFCRDAAMSLALMLETVAKNGPLEKLIEDIPSYHFFSESVPCPDDKKDDLEFRFKEDARGMTTDITDGVKVFFDDGWVLARSSATEAKFRLYSQSDDPDKAMSRLREYVDRAKSYLSG